jgi:tetrathionate reductase subunit B
MTQLSILVDDQLCFDCKACEVACKEENSVPVGLKWIYVVQTGPEKQGERLVTRFSPEMCRHCTKAPCIEVCPEKAIGKRADGIVLIDDELCIGCGDCISACPFGVIGIDPVTNVASKCTLCVHRIDRGMTPACVNACQTQAIYFGDSNDISLRMQQDRARRRRLLGE